jgi:thioredoxin 1
MSVSHLTQSLQDGEFESKVSQSKGLVLVDFWAEWCGPCKTISPILEELAKSHQGTVQVYKMDVDENPKTPSQFHIRGIPTVILFKDGKRVDQIIGSHSKEAFERAIQTYLKVD